MKPYYLFLFVILFTNCSRTMPEKAKEDRPVLRLTHHDGVEEFFINTAQWNFYDTNLWLEIRCSDQLAKEYTDHFPSLEPVWELNVVSNQLHPDAIAPPFKVGIPSAYYDSMDGWISNLYYYEHGGTYDNFVEILQRTDDKILVRMTGEAPDIIHYDGSKPAVKLEFEGWFTHNSKGARSIQ